VHMRAIMCAGLVGRWMRIPMKPATCTDMKPAGVPI
jgi:hypothetical protein